MIIPIRCFTCNNMIASKYEKYKILTAAHASSDEDLLSTITDPENKKIDIKIDSSNELFNSLGIKRYCCKRHLLTHVDLIERI